MVFGIFGFLDLGILEFGILGFWENWKKITKVVFALVRSGPKDNKDNNKDKETSHLLTTALS